MSIRTVLVFCLIGLLHFKGHSQAKDYRAEYIEKYSDLAVKEMKRSGIPASITMAQALLESNNGRSDLALTANNHFGIKCHLTWTGNRFYYDDDDLDECFRVYKRVKDSYEDHSLFLMTRSRYDFLFDLNPTDYKAWARGLKTAGYATNPKYADLLIKIIEDNNLYRLDHMIPANAKRENDLLVANDPAELPETIPVQPIYTRNRIKFVVAENGDDVDLLTAKFDKLKWEIRKYNEIPKKSDIQLGQIIYLQPKRKQASRGYDIHYVEEGDTWYSISQHYGIKLKWLYKRNGAQPGIPVETGQEIFLRGMKN
jgi:hypothetical protein